MMLSRPLIVAALLAFAASALHATDVDLKLGARSFGDERWPEVGVSLGFGPEAWRIRPVAGAAVAFDFLYGGTVAEVSLGAGGDFPSQGRAVASWSLGAAHLEYDHGPNDGSAEAGYAELGLRWVRDDGADFGVNLRYLDGSDITLRTDDPDFAGVRESISTVVASFVMRW